MTRPKTMTEEELNPLINAAERPAKKTPISYRQTLCVLH